MNRSSFGSRCALALLAGGLLAAAPAFADKPSSKGNKGKGESHAQEQKVHKAQKERKKHKEIAQGGYFGDSHRQAVHGYYDQRLKQGKKCPPGLAKKHNGCMPPGQAKKYSLGQPLPRNVTYHAVPPALTAQLGAPPAGYRYIRVDDDILLLGQGTRVVIDALLGLGRS